MTSIELETFEAVGAANDEPETAEAGAGAEGQEGRAFRKALGERIEGLRVAAGMTQTQLAKLSGIPRPNISGILTGRHSTSLERIGALARVLNSTTDFLILGVQPAARPSSGTDTLLLGMDPDLDPLEHLLVAIVRAAGGLTRPARGACVSEVLQVLRRHGG